MYKNLKKWNAFKINESNDYSQVIQPDDITPYIKEFSKLVEKQLSYEDLLIAIDDILNNSVFYFVDGMNYTNNYPDPMPLINMSEGIHFAYSDTETLCIVFVVNSGLEKVFSNNSSYSRFEKFFYKVARHESVHINQFKIYDMSIMDSPNPNNIKKYLSDPLEIMAHARTCADEILEIDDSLENASNKSKTFKQYLSVFQKDSDVFKQFLDYVKQYLKK
jgi:hypothetical protein